MFLKTHNLIVLPPLLYIAPPWNASPSINIQPIISQLDDLSTKAAPPLVPHVQFVKLEFLMEVFELAGVVPVPICIAPGIKINRITVTIIMIIIEVVINTNRK
jgi:hypothetical protein